MGFISPNFNIFSLLHYYLYAFMPHIQGPREEPGVLKRKVKSQDNFSFSMPLASKKSVERTFEIGKMSLIVLFVAYLLQNYILQPTFLPAGYANGIQVGSPGLGRCQLVPFLRGCKAYELELTTTGNTYNLAVQGNPSNSFKVSAKAGKTEGTVKVYLSKDGSLKIGTCSTTLWTSPKKCPKATKDFPNYMILAEDGSPTLVCSGDGSTIRL